MRSSWPVEELETWLATSTPGAENEQDVRLDLTDCMQRLADSDLTIARFYRRVDNLAGAEYHARRAIEQARDGLDGPQLEEAEKLLGTIMAEVEGE